jgi:beige protein homolog 1
MLINTLAGRTYNDLTQYPVFPWVIADYTSSELDLSDPKTFRDLSKPMGCQTTTREAEFRERYKSFAEMGDHSAPAFHYGTHYSSAMIVTSYLIRLQPFVKSYLLLQGGTFDHADRMFFSIEQAWRSASRLNMTDVRELTPEFFFLPEFLLNLNEFDFGARQNEQKSISAVELPPWAKGDPRIFIAKNREALESPFVSKHLHQWIDLVFGHKQKGENAIAAVNVFHHLSYQGAKDLDAITDSNERLATIGIIHNFGQTPYQIFHKAHPARDQTRHKYKRLDTAAESLTRLPSTLLDSDERVASLAFSWKSDKLLCSGAFRLNMPPNYDIYMEWGFSDNSVRFYSAESRKQIGLFEHLHIGQLSGAIFADSKTLITAGTDCTVAVWSVHSTNKAVDIQPKATLFGHRQSAGVLAISRSINALLSASRAGELILWDLNRCEFVRKIEQSLVVECACINDVTGNITLCHGGEISMYSINGDLLLRQDSGDRSGEAIVSCACYEGAANEWLERDILFTGHKRGVVRVWSKVIKEGRFELELIRQLNHTDNARDDGGNVMAAISCILPMPQVVYTGDEDGRVVSWFC